LPYVPFIINSSGAAAPHGRGAYSHHSESGFELMSRLVMLEVSI
jgi:hypothetical protein